MSSFACTLLQLFLLRIFLVQASVAGASSLVSISNVTSAIDENKTNIGDINNMKDIDYYVLTKRITHNMYDKYKLRIPEVKFVCHHRPEEDNITKKDLIWHSSSKVLSHGFFRMHSRVRICSWDKILYHFSRTNTTGFHWIIEDDVYLSMDSRYKLDSYDSDHSDLITLGWRKEYKINDSWPHWEHNKHDYFNFNDTELGATLNTIIRVSGRLIESALEYQRMHNSFIFHELLFYSLCKKNKYSVHNVKDERIKNHALSWTHKSFKIDDISRYTIKHPLKLWYNLPNL